MSAATQEDQGGKRGNRRHPGLNLAHADEKAHKHAESLMFGFWVFLMSDLVLFALLFATYATMLGVTVGGPGPRQLFELPSAAIETAALLASSLSYGMASLVMKHEKGQGWLLFWLGVTLALGLLFLGYEIHDFVGMYAKGGGISRSGQLSAFFALVGTHGLHVTFGSLWIVVMIVQILVSGAERNRRQSVAQLLLVDRVQTRILRLGLFWHFLDIVWIGIFSLVYLQGLAG